MTAFVLVVTSWVLTLTTCGGLLCVNVVLIQIMPELCICFIDSSVYSVNADWISLCSRDMVVCTIGWSLLPWSSGSSADRYFKWWLANGLCWGLHGAMGLLQLSVRGTWEGLSEGSDADVRSERGVSQVSSRRIFQAETTAYSKIWTWEKSWGTWETEIKLIGKERVRVLRAGVGQSHMKKSLFPGASLIVFW